MEIPVGETREPCPFCGREPESEPTRARCSVCGMALPSNRYPHITRIEAGKSSAHFCGVTCMDNFEFMEEGGDD